MILIMNALNFSTSLSLVNRAHMDLMRNLCSVHVHLLHVLSVI